MKPDCYYCLKQNATNVVTDYGGDKFWFCDACWNELKTTLDPTIPTGATGRLT